MFASLSVVVFLTLFLGPFAFWLLNKRYRHKNTNWPVGIIDGVGDIVCLPWFNATVLLLGLIFNSVFLWISLLVGFVVTAAFVYWRKDVAIHNDWSRPKKGTFNLGGWYHTVFHFVQASFMCYGLLLHYDNLFIWIPLICFGLLVILRFLKLYFSKE